MPINHGLLFIICLMTMAASGATNETASLYYEIVKSAFKLAKECEGFLQTKFDEPDMKSFIDHLGSTLDSIVDNLVRDCTGSNSTQRERIYTSFYHFRSTELLPLWKELLIKLQAPQVYHSDLWPAQVTARLSLEFMTQNKILQFTTCFTWM